MATSRTLTPFLENLLSSSKSRYICTPCLRQQNLQNLQSRQQQPQRRSLHGTGKPQPVPRPTPFVPDVPTFLTLIGRGLSAHAAKFESWDKLFTLSSSEMKDLGVEPARSRRYLLRWRQKFRRGEYGVGGDLKYVTDGVGEIRVVEVPSLLRQSTSTSKSKTSANANESASASATATTSTSTAEFVSTMSSPGLTKLVLNVPAGKTTYVLEPGQTTRDLKKPRDFTLKNGHVVCGPYTQVVEGSNGSVVTLRVKEGMWEDRLGQKVFGGERRRAETLHKMGVAEHRKNVR